MEKEKELSQDPLKDPSPEFLRSMVLLENMEMLRMMEEFGLDGASQKKAPAQETRTAPVEEKKK